ncbi:MAG: ABC transporter permease subunit [Leptospiraceae bacterium]|nr:ABC transporter permease subunit [Leptospiraceae bacterium]MCP5498336.1 ABC transporter permease subunit [Leptospiraceae bacterium]
MLNPDTKRRLLKFRNNKRAFYSLLFLLSTYCISLFAPVIANNIPLLVKYEGTYYFPIFSFHSEETFGGTLKTIPNYKKLAKEERFQNGSNYILFPLIPYGVNEDNLASLEAGVIPPTAPDTRHWFGTDDRGRDVFTRLFYGYRISLTFGLVLVFIELFLGTIIGGIQGYFAGLVDLSFQRLIEIISSIPFLYLILIMGSFFGRSFGILLFTYGVISWIGISYYMRGEFYKLRSFQFVDAARAFGVPNYKIILRHIIPNAITPLVTFLPFSLISSISVLSALDFLGYGIPAPNPSWGELIAQGKERLSAWWLIAFPSLALFTTIQLTSFVGEGLRDAFDSKEKVVIH